MCPQIDEFGLSGQVAMVLRDRYGFIKEERDGPNVITVKGREQTVRNLSNQTGTAFGYMAIGIGTVTEASTDTTLTSEVTAGGGARAATLKSITTVTSAYDTAQFITTYTFTGSYNITESGVFNNTIGGSPNDMLCRKTFTSIPVQNGDQLTVTWKVTAS
jgi:hypothetical protein